ncbi:ZIP family metal transporter [Oligella ureolytica]|nr:ZIP family metal transporter [Alcaligenaceae bacterium]HZJ96501.1 ZIP family metal transporter [Oligella sp.]
MKNNNHSESAPLSKIKRPIGLRHSVKLWVGLLIYAAVIVLISQQLWDYMNEHPVVLKALIGGSIAALATAIGTTPVLFSQTLSQRTQDTLYGFGAGVMLAACAFSLIIPGIDAAQSMGVLGGGPWAASGVIGSSMLIGASVLMLLDHILPHEHFIKGREGPDDAGRLRRTWLFVFAIVLHNIPEGLSIGVAYGVPGEVSGNALAVGIAIQDIPEGLVVAVALLAAGYNRWFAVLIGVLSGLIEPIAAVIGAIAVVVSANLLPWGLGFAAGAMLFVVSHEIIPESHRKGHERWATGGLMLGFVLMMMLDTALG